MENTNKNVAANAAPEAAAVVAAVAAAPTVPDEDTMELALSSDRFATLDLERDLNSHSSAYCTMQALDNKARVTLFNACSNPVKLSTMINKRFKLLHIYAEIIRVKSEMSGEMVNAPRVILIDDHGQGYQAVSTGIYNSVKRIISLFGNPATWDAPHTVEVQHVDLKDGQHTFNLLVID